MRLRDIYAESFTAKSLPADEPAIALVRTATKSSPTPTSQRSSMTQAVQIVGKWERLLGVRLNETVVEAHLETLCRWEAKLLEITSARQKDYEVTHTPTFTDPA